MVLTKRQRELFNKIISNRRTLFCRKSNCVKTSIRKLSSKLGYKSTTPVEGLYAALRLQVQLSI